MAMSTTSWLQLLGIMFGVAMMYFTFIKYKRKEINKTEMQIWFGLWIILVTLGIFPFMLDPIIGKLNFYRRLDFFVVTGFFVLLGVGFFNYSTVKKMEKKLENYVREDSLNPPGPK
jgi:hypothetical protein